MPVTYSVDVSSLDVVRSEPEYLLEMLESLLHVVLIVETEAADIHGLGRHAVHAQNIAADTTKHSDPALPIQCCCAAAAAATTHNFC